MIKIVNIIFFFVPLASIIPAFVWMFIGFNSFQYELSLSTVGLFVVVPLIILGAGLFTASHAFSALRHKRSLISRSKLPLSGLFIITLLACVVGSIIVGVVVASTFNKTPPQMFPFDDPQATYMIKYQDSKYWVAYNSTSDKNSSFVCSWERDGKKECRTEINRIVESFVGSSSVELDGFLNKPVILKGEFAYSNKQCILKKCQDIVNSVVVNITSITSVQDK